MTGPKPYLMRAGGGDPRRSAPHVARNAAPIVDVLRGILPDKGLVLELASGSGEHALYFSEAFPGLTIQPSDPDPTAIASIEAWRQMHGAPNLRPPVQIDARSDDWPVERADAILCINMIHISPWSATEGLMKGAARLLASGCPLYLYGAYRRDGVPTAPSNEAFDLSLRERDPEWGLRRLEDVVALAAAAGLALDSVIEMPANNLSVIFRRS